MGQRTMDTGETPAGQSASWTSPFTDAHAIVFVDFGLTVRDGFSDAQVARLDAAIAPVLSSQGFRRLSEDEYEDEDAPVVGFERYTSGEDEELVEFVHIHENHAHLMVHEYRGWQATRDMALSRLEPMLAVFREGEFGDARLLLVYRDAFSNDKPERYSARDVFRSNQHLPTVVFEAGKFWHQQLTLSEGAADDEGWNRIFSRLTIDARIRKGANGDDEEAQSFVHWTEITHRQQMAGNPDGDPAVEWSVDTIRARLDAMHDRNKDIMAELLSHEMAARIGLMESPNEL